MLKYQLSVLLPINTFWNNTEVRFALSLLIADTKSSIFTCNVASKVSLSYPNIAIVESFLDLFPLGLCEMWFWTWFSEFAMMSFKMLDLFFSSDNWQQSSWCIKSIMDKDSSLSCARGRLSLVVPNWNKFLRVWNTVIGWLIIK